MLIVAAPAIIVDGLEQQQQQQRGRRPHRSDLNPIEADAYYVNPSWQREIDEVLHDIDGTLAHALQRMRNTPSAYWIDKKAKILGGTKRRGLLPVAARALGIRYRIKRIKRINRK